MMYDVVYYKADEQQMSKSMQEKKLYLVNKVAQTVLKYEGLCESQFIVQQNFIKLGAGVVNSQIFQFLVPGFEVKVDKKLFNISFDAALVEFVE